MPANLTSTDRSTFTLAFIEALDDDACARLAERLAPYLRPSPTSDEWLDAKATAALIGRSVSWVRRHGHRLPGFSQPNGKGTAVRWSKRALEKWMHGARP